MSVIFRQSNFQIKIFIQIQSLILFVALMVVKMKGCMRVMRLTKVDAVRGKHVAKIFVKNTTVAYIVAQD